MKHEKQKNRLLFMHRKLLLQPNGRRMGKKISWRCRRARDEIGARIKKFAETGE
jgi:hypothetical protein